MHRKCFTIDNKNRQISVTFHVINLCEICTSDIYASKMLHYRQHKSANFYYFHPINLCKLN